MLDLLQETNVVFREAVRSSTLPQQRNVPQRRVTLILVALSDVGHGPERIAADVLCVQP